MSSDYSLILPFDSDDPEFTRGVQVGMVWERLNQAGQVTHELVAARNAEMVMRMAEACNLAFTAEPAGDEWVSVSIGPE